MKSEQRIEIPLAMYQLAEQYHIGQPLALHSMQQRWVRSLQRIKQVVLGAVIIVVLFVLVVTALFLYQLYTEQIPDLQFRLMAGLPGTIVGLMGCVALLITRHMIDQQLPASILVCTEGLLELRPKEIDVTRWDEVKGSLQGPGLEQTKRYKLYRINRKPFSFSEAFEDVEGLAALVREYTQKQRDRK